MNAGFARASRIARHRLALYREQSLFEIKDSRDECQLDMPTEKPWPEHHIAESKSLPYISSSSTLDNTTISASISLESHSVYSTPPPSLILHTPVITVTGPAEQDFYNDSAQEDGTGYQSNDEGKSQYESPNPIHIYTEQDDFSSSAAAPNLGKLARRRGFQELPIITSFPPSHTLLSPLSIVSQISSSKRSPDHNSSYMASPTFTSTTSSFFPRSIISSSQQSSRTDLSTPCDEGDPFSTHGDSFYCTDFFQSGEDVNELSIYTLDGKTGENTNSPFISHHEHSVNSNVLGLANGRPLTTNIYDISAYVSHEGLRPKGRKTRPKILKRSHLSSPVSIDAATSDATHRCLISEDEVSRKSFSSGSSFWNVSILCFLVEGGCLVSHISASTLCKHDIIKSIPRSPTRRPQMQAHRSTMVLADGNFASFVDLINQSENMDFYSYKHFSFPYYPFRKGGQGWSASARFASAINEASKPVSGVSPVSFSGPVENTDQTLLSRDTVPLNSAKSVSFNVGLCIPTPNVIPQLDGDLFRLLDLSFDDFDILSGTDTVMMASKSENLSGSPAESSRIPEATVLPGCDHRTESMSFFNRGPEVQAWISMVNSSLSSGVTPGPNNLLAAVDGVSTDRDETNRNKAEPQTPADSFHMTSQRPKSLGSLPARALDISLEGRCSSVIYSCERRASDISALRPLMLPAPLTFRDSLESISNIDSNWDAEKKALSSSIDFGDTTISKTPPACEHNPDSQATFRGPFGDLLEALHLCSIAENSPDRSISYYLSTTTTDIEEPDKNNPTSDTTVSCGIAL